MNENAFPLTLRPRVMKLCRLMQKYTQRTQDGQRHPWKCFRIFPQHNTSFLNIYKFLIKLNQCTPHNLVFSVACAILISSATNVIERKLVFQYRDRFSSVFRYTLKVVVLGSTRNCICRIGKLQFCYKYVENILT